MEKRYTITWIDQNIVRVEDHQEDDEFYMNGDVYVIRKYRAMGTQEGNAYLTGFLDGVNYCDSQLKNCLHNFINRE